MNIKNLLLLFCLTLLTLTSCDEEDEIRTPDTSNVPWTASAVLNITPQGEDTNFIYNINQSTGDEFWGITDLTFDVSFESEYASIEQISKIDIYAFIEEEVGGAYKYIGGPSGKLVASISEPTEDFQITLSKDQMYDLFEGEFSTSRTDILPGDLFELKWVITGKDGNVLDTRVDCYGFTCTYGFQAASKIVDTWVGEFEATWIEVGPGTVTYSYSRVNVGAKRLVNFVPGDANGEYDIMDMSFGGAYGGPRGGTMTWNGDTGTITITFAESYYTSQYELVSVTPEVLTLKWTNNFSTRYAEYGTVELRRYDGLTWPEITEIINY